MARALVTGVAGFIGSHLARRLLELGWEVVGIDAFVDYYPRWIKERNLTPLYAWEGFSLVEGDIMEANLEELGDGVSVVFHQAAQAGVRASWGEYFQVYTHCNILATQRLLEFFKGRPLNRFVYASSSSVYGNNPDLPLKEASLPQPRSPYGVTKLSAEHLCLLYHDNFGVPTVSLRYFTVYGPGQRPDMAFHRFIKAMFEDKEFPIYGDGTQTRDFTFISDIVESNILAASCPGVEGRVFNIGGGSRRPLKVVVALLEGIMGKKALPRYVDPEKGDVLHTWADISLASRHLGYSPSVALEEGLAKEVEWVKDLYGF